MHESGQLLSQLGGNVSKKIYPKMAHTIIQDELHHALKIVKRAVMA